MGTEIQFCKTERALDVNKDDGCTRIGMYLIPLNYILRSG